MNNIGKYCLWTILTFVLNIFVSCKKEEKILYKEQQNAIEGTWYLDRIKFYDLLNGTSQVTNFYYDSKPPVIQNPFDDLDAQINLSDDGTYSSVSHRLGIYFALIGNQNPTTNPSGDRGVWQLVDNGNKIYFDKGIYEFEGSSPRHYQITKSTNDSLQLETTEPKAIYDWAYLYGISNMRLELYPFIRNGCTTGDDTYGGAEFAQLFGPNLGYRDATLDTDIKLNPFGIGLRRGLVQAFNDIYQPNLVPIFDSCYQANVTPYYNSGVASGNALKSSVQSRFSKITFIFSRKPSP